MAASIAAVLASSFRLYRSTGADAPYGRLDTGRPGAGLESWFWRLVDVRTGTVLLLSATRVREAGCRSWLNVVLAARYPDGSRSIVERALTDVRSDPSDIALSATSADGDRIEVDREHLDVDLTGTGQLQVRLEERWPWPRRSLGGLGLGHLVPGLSQYWHPHLLGATAAGSARFDGRELQLDGASVYAEKNWGRGGAPRAWWWGQATCGPDVMVAFAGGVLDIGPVRVPATAVAVRVRDQLAAFSPPLALMSTAVSPGTWALDARSARWAVRIRATASGVPFDLPVPTPGRQTALLSHQHQDGELELVVRRDGRERFRGGSAWAGLERGGRQLTRATG